MLRVNCIFHPSGYKTMCTFHFVICFSVAETGLVFIDPVSSFLGTELDFISQLPLQLRVAIWLTFGQWNLISLACNTSPGPIISVISCSAGSMQRLGAVLEAVYRRWRSSKLEGVWVGGKVCQHPFWTWLEWKINFSHDVKAIVYF